MFATLQPSIRPRIGDSFCCPAEDPIPTVPWTPAYEIPTHGAWLDCADETTISEPFEGGLVIDDKFLKGNGLSALINPPTSGVRTLNGLNVLDFEPPDYMQRLNRDIGASGNHLAIGVFGADVIDAQIDTLFCMSTSGADYQFQAGNNFDFIGEINVSGTGNAGSISTLGVDNGPSVYCVVFDYELGLSYIYINGTLAAAPAAYVTKLDQFQEHKVMQNRGSTQYPDGFMAEWIWGDTKNTSYRQKCEGYLSWKWGIESKLDASHPYKSAPPTT